MIYEKKMIQRKQTYKHNPTAENNSDTDQQKLWVYWKDKVLYSLGRIGFLKQQWLFQQGIAGVELPCLDLS